MTEQARQLPDLLTRTETAEWVRCDPSTVDRLVALGRFPKPVKFGGALVRFRRDDILKFLTQKTTAAPLPARTRKANRRKNKSRAR